VLGIMTKMALIEQCEIIVGLDSGKARPRSLSSSRKGNGERRRYQT
jgi:hypothetical protein